MPRSTIANRHSAILDSLLVLRDLSAPAISATTAETPIAFSATKELGYRAVFSVSAYTGYVSGTAQWTLTIQVCDTAGGTYTTVSTIVLDGTAKVIDSALSGAHVESRLATAAYVRVNATKTGSPGDLSYSVFLSKLG